MNWQPIETAPKDGTLLLLYWHPMIEKGKAGWAVGHFQHGEWTDDDEISEWREPTHWMPLPEPPK